MEFQKVIILVVGVGQSRVDISEGNDGVMVNNIVGGHTKVFVPNRNVLHSNAMTCVCGGKPRRRQG